MTLKCLLDFLQSCDGSKVHEIFVPVHFRSDWNGEVYRSLNDKEISLFYGDRIDRIEFYYPHNSDNDLFDIYLREYDYSYEFKKI